MSQTAACLVHLGATYPKQSRSEDCHVNYEALQHANRVGTNFFVFLKVIAASLLATSPIAGSSKGRSSISSSSLWWCSCCIILFKRFVNSSEPGSRPCNL